MKDNHFDAPWSGTLKAVSWGTTLFLLALPVVIGLLPHPGRGSVWLVAAANVLLLVGTGLLTIRGYEVTPNGLFVRRLLWQTQVSLQGLKTAELEPGATARSFRSCGNGGLFAFSGWYRNSLLGSYRMFATDLKRTVVLRFDHRTVVVSPERPTDFIRAVRQKAGLE